MNTLHLNNPEMLVLLWLVPAAALLFYHAARRRRRALNRFVAPLPAGRLVKGGPGRRRWKTILLPVAVALLIAGLARPAWNLEESPVKRRGRDVVFLLDVSRSMLARDLAPNRLERAKIAVADCLEKLDGDRVALVVFAGSAAVKCPLTLDYGFFRLALEDVTTASVSRGGSMPGDAIRAVLERVFAGEAGKFRDIILLTDGGDQESFAVEAAAAIGDKGVRLLIVGLGDPEQGSRIPVAGEGGRETFLTYRGREVWSRLEAKRLKEMAAATPGGVYLPVETGAVDLGEVYAGLVATAEKKELESRRLNRYEERFQLFLGLALLILALEALVCED